MNLSEFTSAVGDRHIDRRSLNSGKIESCGTDRLFSIIQRTEMEPAITMRQFLDSGEHQSPHATYYLMKRPDSPAIADQAGPDHG